jgi:AcrR family transcriptional regulator
VETAPQRGPVGHRDDTRDRLVAAAAAVFSEKGYDRAGVQEIARRAGLTTGAIYGRFSGKAELLKVAIESCCTDELDELFAQGAVDGHVTDVLRTVGAHLVAPAAPAEDDSGALLLEAFVAARRDPEVANVVRAVLEDRAARLAELVETARATGDVDAGLDTQSIVRFCHAVGLGFLLYEAVSLPLPPAEPWQQLINRLVASVAPAASPTKEQ